jgi:hypothetical protein
VTWDNRDLHPSFGSAARARAAESTPGRVPVAAPCEHSYPPARDLCNNPRGLVDRRFPRYQSKSITLAANTSFQLVVQFAGRPDRIDVAASAAGVNFRFRNRGEPEGDALRVPNAAFHDTDISKDIVEAQDPTGAGGQICTAHGLYIDPYV